MRPAEFHRIETREDPETGLAAVFALHDLTLGPALGGIRRWPYASDADARADAMRLAQGMTAKHALANLPFGGGKCVVRAPRGDAPGRRARPITAAELRVLGQWIEELRGEYVGAADVGVSVADLATVGERTRHLAGMRAGGETGPPTALGVFTGIEVVARRLGFADLRGARVAVQGLGKVGMPLSELLHAAGASLIVADPNAHKRQRAAARFGAEIAPLDRVLLASADIVAPCALGGAVTRRVAETMTARAIAGAANNQLASADAAAALRERGVLYAPDYVINAGGVISAGLEYLGRGGVEREIREIGPRLQRIFDVATASGRPEAQVADALARQRLADAAA